MIVKYRRSLILLVLAALLPLIVLSAALGAAWLRQQQEVMEQQAFDHLHRLSARVDRELTAQSEILHALAQSPLLDGAVHEAAVFEFAKRVRRVLSLWHTVVLSDVEGNRLIDVPEPVAGGKGKVVDAVSHSRAVETRAPVIGRIVRGPRNRPAFAIRVPVIREGHVIYVLSAVIHPDVLGNLLLSEALPIGWSSAVVDTAGNLVARTIGPATQIGQPASDSAREARRRAPGGLYEGVNREGVPMITVYRVFPASNWSVHVAIPREVYHAPLRRALWLLAGGALLSLVLVGTFLWLLGRELHLGRRQEAAQEEARRLEALGRMTGGIAHDFNNLLMIVQGSAEAIRRRPADAQILTTFVDAILTAVQRGEALTRQLVAFGRRSPHQPVSFALPERAPELTALLQRSTRGDITTSVAIPDETWPIYADPNALEVALINLAVNARDAMPEGGHLSVSAMNVTLGKRADGGTGLRGDYIAVSVEDTGVGIPADQLGRIFEPFFTTKPTGKGTGLGLSQVFGFAKQSGGAVTVTSTLGLGTSVTLYLPRSRDAAARTVSAPAPPVAQGEGRVLLIEDNAEVAQVTQSMLVAVGYRVTWARNAAAALGRLDQGERFDAVLSDIVLEGGVSGLEVAPCLRERCPELPIVLMTGYSDALAKGVAHGFPVLPKPFGQAQVVEVLRRARHPPSH
jgi:signal transduction histidine kinase